MKIRFLKSIISFCTALWILTSCAGTQQMQDPIPTHKTIKISSTYLGEERVINIWTPPNYDSVKDSFMVMYMPDGGLKEDFPHIANTIAELVAAKKIPPMILVGIENTQRRRDLSGPSQVKADEEIAPLTDGASVFRSFMKEELFPIIDKTYRTKPRKGIIGESLAGLFVVETYLLQPQMFDYYIAMDPSLWWNDGYLVKTAKEHLSKHQGEKKVLWFAGSNAEDISKYTQSLSEVLTTQNVPWLIWHYSDEPKEKHNTIYRATKEKALIWTFGQQY